MCERATSVPDRAPASGRPRSRSLVRPADADALAEPVLARTPEHREPVAARRTSADACWALHPGGRP